MTPKTMDVQAPAPPHPPSVVCVGHATLDAILAVPSLPAPDERVPATDGMLAGGGPAATAAVALARLGVPVAFAGRVADDEAGRFIRAGLEDEGVDVTLLATEAGRSPFTAVLLDPDGGRALLPAPGALPPLAVTPGLLAAVRAARWVHLDHVGATLLPELLAAGVETPISIDGGNPLPGLALAGVALYAPTAARLVERGRSSTLEEALERAVREGARLVVATDGERGAWAGWLDDAGRFRSACVPAPTVTVVSTLGAGDVFHGALLAALVEGQAPVDALAFANTAAAASTRALDGRAAIPTRPELDAMLAGGEATPVAAP